jgi:hypothetical protein
MTERLHTGWFAGMRDGRDHAVTDEEFARRGEHPAGHVWVICGHVVDLAPMVAPSRPPCGRCLAVFRARQGQATPRDAAPTRHRKPGLLRRLLTRTAQSATAPPLLPR